MRETGLGLGNAGELSPPRSASPLPFFEGEPNRPCLMLRWPPVKSRSGADRHRDKVVRIEPSPGARATTWSGRGDRPVDEAQIARMALPGAEPRPPAAGEEIVDGLEMDSTGKARTGADGAGAAPPVERATSLNPSASEALAGPPLAAIRGSRSCDKLAAGE